MYFVSGNCTIRNKYKVIESKCTTYAKQANDARPKTKLNRKL